MQTKIETTDGECTFITQQYEIGLYVAIYQGGRCVSQNTSNKKEEAFHKSIRKKALKQGHKILD